MSGNISNNFNKKVSFSFVTDFIKTKRKYFTALTAGPPDSGKSYFVKKLIREIKDEYDIIVCFSGSWDDYEYYNFEGENENGYNEDPLVPKELHQPFDVDTISSFVSGLEYLKSKNINISVLLIFDDFSGSCEVRNFDVFRKLVSRSKHIRAASIINVHFLSQVDPLFRSSVNYITAFRQDNNSIEYLAATVIGYNKKSLLDTYNNMMDSMPTYSALFIQRLEPYKIPQVLFMTPIGYEETNKIFNCENINDEEL